MQMTVAWLIHACEIVNKRRQQARTPAVLALLLIGSLLSPSQITAQEAPAAPPARGAGQGADDDSHADTSAVPAHPAPHADAAHAGADEHHGESIWVTLARVANFALLAGGLFYFLRAPVAAHLTSRGEQIRGDLATAAQVRADATQRLADIERRLKELPAELEQLTQRGAEEVAAEEARIAQQADIERERLVAQARREIDQHVRTARQALTAHAAALSIEVARERLRTTLDVDDQRRLADTFTTQVGGAQ